MARHDIGETVPLTAAFDDADANTAFDPPTVTLVVRKPDETETTYEWPAGAGGITRTALGRFRHLEIPDMAGRWQYWYAGDGDTPAVEPSTFDVRPLITPNWRPVVADVGAILRARTKARLSETFAAGNEIGTFNDETRPTGDQVERLIDQAVDDVTDTVGTDICTQELQTSAGRVAAIGAALLVELSY